MTDPQPTAQARPTYTDRTAPAPWGLCVACGSSLAALPGVGDYAREHQCARCAAKNALRDTAEQHLEQLVSPILGAWAAYWGAAGVSLDSLDFITDHLSGSLLNDRAARSYRRATLRRLARLYRVPTVTHQHPDRLTLNPQAVPRVERLAPADPSRGLTWAELRDAGGARLEVFPGLDTLALTLPDGDTLLIHLGYGGLLDLGCAPAVRVPPALLAEVLAMLGSAEGEQ